MELTEREDDRREKGRKGRRRRRGGLDEGR